MSDSEHVSPETQINFPNTPILVSVILPVFNGSAYLRDAVESVLSSELSKKMVMQQLCFFHGNFVGTGSNCCGRWQLGFNS
jgi:hypothetical protein